MLTERMFNGPNRARLGALVRGATFGLAMAVAGSAGCKRRPAAYDVRTPVLCIAVDGLEWDVALPLVQQGRMPHLRSLMERGTFGNLESFEPTKSPAIWTSVATGKAVDKHGIDHFVFKDANGQACLYNSCDRQTKAFWNILSDYGRTTGTFGYWLTYPVEPVKGLMVAQTNTTKPLESSGDEFPLLKGALREGLSDQVHPPDRQDEFMHEYARVDATLAERERTIFGTFSHPLSPLGERLWENCHWAFRADAGYVAMAEHVLSQGERFDVLTVYVGGTDVVGHRFWRYMQPDRFDHPPSAEDVANLGDVVQDYYIYFDQIVGRLLRDSPQDITVLVVSDHGMKIMNQSRDFEPAGEPVKINSAGHYNAPPGVLIAAGRHVRRTQPAKPLDELTHADLPSIGSVFDITPTLLALQGIPVGQDMDGQVLARVIEPAFLEQYPVRTCASHDDEDWLERRAELAESGDEFRESADRLDQLRDLGYIGESGEDVPAPTTTRTSTSQRTTP